MSLGGGDGDMWGLLGGGHEVQAGNRGFLSEPEQQQSQHGPVRDDTIAHQMAAQVLDQLAGVVTNSSPNFLETSGCPGAHGFVANSLPCPPWHHTAMCFCLDNQCVVTAAMDLQQSTSRGRRGAGAAPEQAPGLRRCRPDRAPAGGRRHR